jgi:hypothetical protein
VRPLRRRSGLLSMAGLGSVSDHCVHALHCPTVVVKDSVGHAGGDAAVCAGTAVSGAKPPAAAA